MGLINYDAKEVVLEKVKEFRLTDEDLNKRIQIRNEFVSNFDIRISNLTQLAQVFTQHYLMSNARHEVAL